MVVDMDVAGFMAVSSARVNSADGLLETVGCGWSIFFVPHLPFDVSVRVAGVLIAEPHEVSESPNVWSVDVAGPDGNFIQDDERGTGLEALVQLPVPKPLYEGQPIMQPVSAVVKFRATRSGRHTLVSFVEGNDRNRGNYPFAIVVDESLTQ